MDNKFVKGYILSACFAKPENMVSIIEQYFNEHRNLRTAYFKRILEVIPTVHTFVMPDQLRNRIIQYCDQRIAELNNLEAAKNVGTEMVSRPFQSLSNIDLVQNHKILLAALEEQEKMVAKMKELYERGQPVPAFSFELKQLASKKLYVYQSGLEIEVRKMEKHDYDRQHGDIKQPSISIGTYIEKNENTGNQNFGENSGSIKLEQKVVNKNQSAKRKRSWLEIGSWIAAIIGTIVILWQLFN